MKAIVVPPPGAAGDIRDDWAPLIDGLSARGLEPLPPDTDPRGAESLVAISRDYRIFIKSGLRVVPREKRALIALEPPVTAPGLYTRLTRRSFGYRYAASPLWAETLDGQHFPWPQRVLERPARKPPGLDGRPYRVSMVVANKRSAVLGSLYHLRRKFVREAHRRKLSLALAGPLWDQRPLGQVGTGLRAAAKATMFGRWPHARLAFSDTRSPLTGYIGTVRCKEEAFDLAPLTVVIENSPDYLSEKLVDAVAGGSVPLYVGPPLDTMGIPPDIAVQVPADPTCLVECALSLTLEDIVQVAQAGEEWLRSESAWALRADQVLRNLGESVGSVLCPHRTF